MPTWLNTVYAEQEQQAEGTQLVVDTLHWAGTSSLLASCSLWLGDEQQVSLKWTAGSPGLV